MVGVEEVPDGARRSDGVLSNACLDELCSGVYLIDVCFEFGADEF